jgi:hypothetical protein
MSVQNLTLKPVACGCYEIIEPGQSSYRRTYSRQFVRTGRRPPGQTDGKENKREEGDALHCGMNFGDGIEGTCTDSSVGFMENV